MGVPGIPDGIHPGNNIMERLQGTQRERTKVMRGFARETSTQVLVDGLRAYYNLVRPHMGLEGRTPCEVAGIETPRTVGVGRLQAMMEMARGTTPA
ncbi:MAG: integrase core domain-containing protein [Thermoplasmata archaeon]